MILLSQSVLLTPAPGLDLNAPIIGYQSLLTRNNVTADYEDADFPAVNLSSPMTTYKWKSTSILTQYVTIDTSPDDPVDYIGLARHNFGSTQCSVEVQALIDGSWVTVFAEAMLGSDSPAILRIEETYAEAFRLKLNPSGDIPPQLAVIFVGKLLVMARRIYVGHTPLPYGKSLEVTTGEAESGDYQGRIVTKRKLDTTANFQNLTPSWYRTYMAPFIEAVEDQAFFFGWRPYTYPTEVGYAWIKGNPQPTNQRSNGMMQISVPMGGLVL